MPHRPRENSLALPQQRLLDHNPLNPLHTRPPKRNPARSAPQCPYPTSPIPYPRTTTPQSIPICLPPPSTGPIQPALPYHAYEVSDRFPRVSRTLWFVHPLIITQRKCNTRWTLAARYGAARCSVEESRHVTLLFHVRFAAKWMWICDGMCAAGSWRHDIWAACRVCALVRCASFGRGEREGAGGKVAWIVVVVVDVVVRLCGRSWLKWVIEQRLTFAWIDFVNHMAV